MERYLERFIAVPIRWMAQVSAHVAIIEPTVLWSTCWKLSRSPEDGSNLLSWVCKKYGIERTRQTAEKMLEQEKQCILAATMCSIELQCSQGMNAANQWVKMAKDGGYKEAETLLHWELVLSDFIDGYEKDKIVEQILSRNDLPASATLEAMLSKANGFLEKGAWDKAEQIADHILGIQEQPDARIIKWVVCLARGEQAQSDEHLNKAREVCPHRIFNLLIAQGWLYLGRADNAMESLYDLGEAAAYVMKHNTSLGRLARSEEYRNFCRERDKK